MFKILYDDKITANLTPDYFFPFIKNDVGKSPFEICLATNPSAAGIFLKYLKYQPVLYHSNEIIQVLPKLISLNLNIGEYLDSRRQTTDLLNSENSIYYFNPIQTKNYELRPFKLWPNLDDFKDQFKEHPKTKMKVNSCRKCINFFFRIKEKSEIDCKLEVLDIPYVCSMNSNNSKVGDEFFKALAGSKGFDLFAYKSI